MGNHSSNLHCVVVLSWWWWYTYVNVMVVVVAMGWFLSTHWHRYFTCTRATCSVVVFFGGGGGRCTYVIVTVVVVGLSHPLQHVSVACLFSPIGAEAVLALEQICTVWWW